MQWLCMNNWGQLILGTSVGTVPRRGLSAFNGPQVYLRCYPHVLQGFLLTCHPYCIVLYP